MDKLQFNTNIKCMGCVGAVSPELDAAVGPQQWEVDLVSPDKVLTVQGENLSQEAVVAALARAGYQATPR
jgi:copper chaperone CopZ